MFISGDSLCLGCGDTGMIPNPDVSDSQKHPKNEDCIFRFCLSVKNIGWGSVC